MISKRRLLYFFGVAIFAYFLMNLMGILRQIFATSDIAPDKFINLLKPTTLTGCDLELMLVNLDDTWKVAFAVPEKFYVFSAYLMKDYVLKIVAVGVISIQEVSCKLWYEERTLCLFMVVPASMYEIPEAHGYGYKPLVVQCRVPLTVSDGLRGASLVFNRDNQSSPVLRVHRRTEDWKPTHNFTLCPAPLNRKYNKTGEFLQYIEVNGIFGADHFIFYNNSVDDDLKPFIEHYVSTGQAEVLQWRIPPFKQAGTHPSLMHYFGQVIAQCDCFYRAMLTSRFVVAIDMDEVIIPMRKDNWLSVMGNDTNVAAYLFQNTFFKKEWKQNPHFQDNELLKKYPVDALLYTKRETKIWFPGARSKYIARPEGITLAGIHAPFRLETGYASFSISSEDGLLAHYRNWEDYRPARRKVVEPRMEHFSQDILKRVSKIVKTVLGQE